MRYLIAIIILVQILANTQSLLEFSNSPIVQTWSILFGSEKILDRLKLAWNFHDHCEGRSVLFKIFFLNFVYIIISGKTFCQACKKKCSGEVLRVQDKYFHISCFKCAQCNASLAQGGFFAREDSYYCTKVHHLSYLHLRRDSPYPVQVASVTIDQTITTWIIQHVQDYRERWGTKCAGCGEYVEGDVVTAGEKHAFHPNCFHCQRCRKPLLGQGAKVTLVQGMRLRSWRIVVIHLVITPSTFRLIFFLFQDKLSVSDASVFP